MEKNDTVAASKATTNHISAAAVSETIAEVNNTSTAIVDKDPDVSLLEYLPQSSYGLHYFIMMIMLQQLFKFDNKNLH